MFEVVVRIHFPFQDLLCITGSKPMINPMGTWCNVEAFCAYVPKSGHRNPQIAKTVNRYGFISTPEIELYKEPGTIRIVFLGGSSTAGTGYVLADVDTWPWRTVEALRKRFPERKFDFINAALSGYSTFESYGRLWSRIRFFNPDILVVNHGWNELYYFQHCVGDNILAWKKGFQGNWNIQEYLHIQLVPPRPSDPFISWSQLLVKIRLAGARLQEGEVGSGTANLIELPALTIQQAAQVFQGNLQLFQSTAKAWNVKFFVCKQPTLIVPNLAPEHQRKCVYRLHGFGHNSHVQAFAAMYASIDALIPAADIIDLTSMSGRPEFFCDHIHPTLLGIEEYTRLMTEALAKAIAP